MCQKFQLCTLERNSSKQRDTIVFCLWIWVPYLQTDWLLSGNDSKPLSVQISVPAATSTADKIHIWTIWSAYKFHLSAASGCGGAGGSNEGKQPEGFSLEHEQWVQWASKGKESFQRRARTHARMLILNQPTGTSVLHVLWLLISSEKASACRSGLMHPTLPRFSFPLFFLLLFFSLFLHWLLVLSCFLVNMSGRNNILWKKKLIGSTSVKVSTSVTFADLTKE